MGTLVVLYKHPEALRMVSELNERNRRWNAGDAQGYWDLGKALDIQEDTGMPRGVQEIDFESKKHPGIFTGQKIHHLGAFLESHSFIPFNKIFGYPSWYPEDWFRIPNWEKARELIRENIAAYRKSVHADDEGSVRYFKQLEAFEEMVLWILGHQDRKSFFLKWSA